MVGRAVIFSADFRVILSSFSSRRHPQPRNVPKRTVRLHQVKSAIIRGLACGSRHHIAVYRRDCGLGGDVYIMAALAVVAMLISLRAPRNAATVNSYFAPTHF
jgi:hypothetical protein